MKSLPARSASSLVGALATGLTILGAAACSTSVDALPPLGTDPTAEELTRHATRYCSRLETCAPGQAGATCLGRMTEHDDTPEGRRSSARMWNAFSECMVLECTAMAACFGAKTTQLGVEQAKDGAAKPTHPALPTATPSAPNPSVPVPSTTTSTIPTPSAPTPSAPTPSAPIPTAPTPPRPPAPPT